MGKTLSQAEIDSLVDALNSLKNYADDNSISADILNNQVVLTQSEIDKLLESLGTFKSAPVLKPNVNVALSQGEIDSLIDALSSYKEYGQFDALNVEMSTNQSVLTQSEIDVLIDKLLSIKDA